MDVGNDCMTCLLTNLLYYLLPETIDVWLLLQEKSLQSEHSISNDNYFVDDWFENEVIPQAWENKNKIV